MVAIEKKNKYINKSKLFTNRNWKRYERNDIKNSPEHYIRISRFIFNKSITSHG